MSGEEQRKRKARRKGILFALPSVPGFGFQTRRHADLSDSQFTGGVGTAREMLLALVLGVGVVRAAAGRLRVSAQIFELKSAHRPITRHLPRHVRAAERVAWPSHSLTTLRCTHTQSIDHNQLQEEEEEGERDRTCQHLRITGTNQTSTASTVSCTALKIEQPVTYCRRRRR
jgi:hypothetical protein